VINLAFVALEGMSDSCWGRLSYFIGIGNNSYPLLEGKYDGDKLHYDVIPAKAGISSFNSNCQIRLLGHICNEVTSSRAFGVPKFGDPGYPGKVGIPE
jgi:hypothetical protein